MGASLHFGRVKGKQEAPTPCRVRDVEPGLTALISLRERPVTRALVPVVGRAEGAGSPGVGKPLTEKWQRGWGGVGGSGCSLCEQPSPASPVGAGAAVQRADRCVAGPGVTSCLLDTPACTAWWGPARGSWLAGPPGVPW